MTSDTRIATFDDPVVAERLRTLILSSHRNLRPWVMIVRRKCLINDEKSVLRVVNSPIDVVTDVYDVTVCDGNGNKMDDVVLTPIWNSMEGFLECL